MMKKYLLLVVVLFIFSGCSELLGPKIIKVPKKTYKNALVYANGCGKNLKEAKENAKINLSANIVSIVDSTWETKAERNNFLFLSSAKKEAKVQSSFMILSPKFDNHFIQKELFKPDMHCIDIILDNDSLVKYENITNSIYREIYEVVIRNDMNIRYAEKEKFAQKIINSYKDKIDEYNKISNFINYLANKQVKPIFTVESIKSMINSYPYVDFRVDGELAYGKELKFIPLVNDEDVKSLKYRWDVNGQIYNSVYLKTKFNAPGSYRVTLIVYDNANLKSQVSKTITISNQNPVASFRVAPDKDIYFIGERITFYNSSKDSENDVVSYYWDFGNGYSTRMQNATTSYSSVGEYTVTLQVVDKFNTQSTFKKSIKIESDIYKKAKLGMTKDEIFSTLGLPAREINLNITSKLNSFIKLNERLIENIGLESKKAYMYGDYWLILRGKILKCLIYKEHFEKQDCDWFKQNRPQAIAK